MGVKTQSIWQPAQRIEALPTQFFATLTKKVQEKVDAGHQIINFGQGNPDLPTPAHIVRALQEAAEEPLYHKYSPFSGYRFLKEAIAAFYECEYAVKLDPDTEVAILFGGKIGLIEVAQVLLNPGDLCLVPDPGYPDYWSGISLAGADMHFMPLLEGNHFLPDYQAIPEQVSQAAKLMFINYPNNPTAGVASPEFFDKTIKYASDHDIFVCHDFAYGAIGFDGLKPPSFLQHPDAKRLGIEIYTLSKTYNMAGWRVAFAVGNPEVISWINQLQDHQFVSLFGGIQKAAAEALLGPQDCVKELVQRYETRRNSLFRELERIGWRAERPKGSFFAWLPVPSGFTASGFADYLLDHAHVVVAPGVGFGTHGEGYVRVGLLSDEDKIVEAIQRIERLKLF